RGADRGWPGSWPRGLRWCRGRPARSADPSRSSARRAGSARYRVRARAGGVVALPSVLPFRGAGRTPALRDLVLLAVDDAAVCGDLVADPEGEIRAHRAVLDRTVEALEGELHEFAAEDPLRVEEHRRGLARLDEFDGAALEFDRHCATPFGVTSSTKMS